MKRLSKSLIIGSLLLSFSHNSFAMEEEPCKEIDFPHHDLAPIRDGGRRLTEYPDGTYRVQREDEPPFRTDDPMIAWTSLFRPSALSPYELSQGLLEDDKIKAVDWIAKLHIFLLNEGKLEGQYGDTDSPETKKEKIVQYFCGEIQRSMDLENPAVKEYFEETALPNFSRRVEAIVSIVPVEE